MLRWIDGFDHYGTNTARLTEGAYSTVGTNISLSTTTPRTGSHCLRQGSASGDGPRKSLGGNTSSFVFGMAYRIDAYPTVNGGQGVWKLLDENLAAQLSLVVKVDGSLSLRRGSLSGTEVANSGAYVLGLNNQHYIETKVTVSNSGSCEVRVDGVARVTFTGDTADTSVQSAASLVLFPATNGSGGNKDIDDLYLCDLTGGVNDDFLGDLRVRTLYPDADTAQEDWDKSAGDDSFAMVDEAAPNDDTDYLSSDTPGEATELELAALPTTPDAVHGVMAVVRARKTEAGTGVIDFGVRSDGVAQASSHALTISYHDYFHVMDEDPGVTDGVWLPAAVDALRTYLNRAA